MHFKQFVRLFFALMALTAILMFSSSNSLNALEAVQVDADSPISSTGLFVEIPADRSAQRVSDKAADVRTRDVVIDTSQFFNDDGTLAKAIRLNLFDDVSVVAIQDQVITNPSGSVTWMGRIDGYLYSNAVLVFKDGIMIGKATIDQVVYEIRYVADDRHRIVQVDPRMLNDEVYDDGVLVSAEELEAAAQNQPNDNRAPEVASDDGSVLDVLVVYTAAAETAAGGQTAIESLIELGVAETNQAYENSGVDQRIFLVHSAEISYTESGSHSTDLDRLRLTSDGFLDDAHTLRDTYHADFIALIVDVVGSGCGIAYLQDSPFAIPSALFDPYAVSVTRYDCVSPNYTFAHELGHNMGLRHDWYVDDTVANATYNHGHINLTDTWRTVMSYNDYCSDNGSSCSRLLYFSNPSLTLGGDAVGVASGTSTSCTAGSSSPDPTTCDADNATILGITAANNAAFRTSQITWLGNTTNWATDSNWSGGSAPRFLDDALIPTSPSGGNFPSISSGTLNVRNVTIETGATFDMSGGTLNVYGDWDEEGTGQFNGTGGTVAFISPLDQEINANASSTFNNVEIGDGTGTQDVTLLSNIDVNGYLDIMSGSSLLGDSYTVEVAGNWIDGGDSYIPETSTVVFDGVTQTISKTVSAELLNVPFTEGEGSCCSSANLPSGWARFQDSGLGFLGGENSGSTGAAIRWNDSAEAWLVGGMTYLSSGSTYNISFDHRSLLGGSTERMTVYIGSAPVPAAMSTSLTSNTTSSNSYTNTDVDFTVATSGVYYFGFFSEQVAGGGYAALDNILLNSSSDAQFYNLQIDSTGSAIFLADADIGNNLTISGNGTLDVASQDVTVEGSVTNNGSIEMTKATSAATQFRIFNDAGDTTQYYLADITPSGNMGNVEVVAYGNQTQCSTNVGDNLISRCFTIVPDTAQSATIRFWYLSSELNGQTAADLTVWHYDGVPSNYSVAGSVNARLSSGTNQWVEMTGVSTYSPFLIGNDAAAPTAVTLSSSQAGDLASPYSIWILASALLVISLGTLWMRRPSEH